MARQTPIPSAPKQSKPIERAGVVQNPGGKPSTPPPPTTPTKQSK